MADTPLPSVATVNDAQLAAMLEVYGDAAGYQAAMIRHIIQDIRKFKQAEIQAQARAARDQIAQDEAEAMAAVEQLIGALTSG